MACQLHYQLSEDFQKFHISIFKPEKGKPLEKVGRKVTGLILPQRYGGRAAGQIQHLKGRICTVRKIIEVLLCYQTLSNQKRAVSRFVFLALNPS
jgi:hypothetical protein